MHGAKSLPTLVTASIRDGWTNDNRMLLLRPRGVVGPPATLPSLFATVGYARTAAFVSKLRHVLYLDDIPSIWFTASRG